MRLDLTRTPAHGDLAVRGDELGGAARVALFVDEAAPEGLKSMPRGEGEVTGRALDSRVPAGRFRATVWSVDPPLAAAAAALILVPIVTSIVLWVVISSGFVEAATVWDKLQVCGPAYLVLAAVVIVVRKVAAARRPQAVVELTKVESQ
jgi:hypothetical protein